MRLNNNGIKNILIVRNDRLGEFLLNIPALRALKETFPVAKITAVINPYLNELAGCVPYIDEIIRWKQGPHSWLEKFRLIKGLRKRNIDMAVMLNPSKEFNILTFLAGIHIRVGYNHKWGFLLTQKKEDKKYLGLRHEVEYNLELVGLVGAKTADKALFLSIDKSIMDSLDLTLKIDNPGPLVSIHPWTSDPIKQWPLEYFRELAERLAQEFKVKVVIVGGALEFQKSKEIFKNACAGNLFDLTGKTSLLELGAVLKKSKFLISGDSGPVHLACCVGTPVLALFRNDIPGKCAKRWGPYCRGSIVVEKNSLKEITVDEVLEKARGLLN